MILESDKIRLELTQLDNISVVVQNEHDNSEFIGQYDFDGHRAVIENDDEMHLSLFAKSDNSLVGHVILAGIKGKNDAIEFRRIVISRKGCGYGKSAINLIKKYCFEVLKAHRIWLDVYTDNIRAIGLYKSQGFRTEGVLRDSLKQNGTYRSLRIMSILKSDPYNDLLTHNDQ